MISQNTIQKVEDLNLVNVVEKYGPKLKKSGKDHWGCCPFHKEDTPSFSVSEQKQFYKCFGCDEGGNSIKFVMKVGQLSFQDAIKDIAGNFSIEVEYDTSKENQELHQRAAKTRKLAEVNQLALEYFQSITPEPLEGWNNIPDLPIGVPGAIEEFELCYSGKEWTDLTDHLKAKGVPDQQAGRLKLITRTKDERLIDFYRNRLMFPIRDTRGRVVAFGGRRLDDSDQKAPKYLNSPTTDLYNKSSTLYGLFQNRAAIEDAQACWLVEGYTDVVAMVASEHSNVTAPCGTSLTAEHAKLLRQHCTHVHILTDGDEAGRKAAQKDVEILLRAGLTCDITYLPDGHDPESFLFSGGALDTLMKVDAVEERLNSYFAHAISVPQREEALKKAEKILALLQSETLRKQYANELSESQNLPKQLVTDVVRAASGLWDESEEAANAEFSKIKLPPGVQADYYKYGFYQWEDGDKSGLYFMGRDMKPVQKSNCTIKPLFHIYSQDSNQNTRIIKINNGTDERVINPTSKAFISTQTFSELLWSEGNFLFYGEKIHLHKLITYLGPRFPLAIQINVLGWQPEGFFAFADGIFTDHFIKAREDGMVDHEGKFFFLPAFSNIYAQIREGDDDPFIEDRKTKYRPSEVTFKDYALQCQKVFGENGTWAICWFTAALFRSIIHENLDFFPHLFLQGEKGSGKSQIAWAVSDIIYKKRAPFNLNHGTDAGFAGRMENDRDCLAWLDEYHNDLPEPRFQAMKGGYDGVGREKKNLSNMKKNKTDKVLNAMLISGQYLPTRDDNSLYSRSLVLEVLKKSYTKEEKADFQRIGEMRGEGLSKVLTEIISNRDLIEDKFPETYHAANEKLRELVSDSETRTDERVMGNVAVVLAVVSILQDRIEFPVNAGQLQKMALAMVSKLSEQLDDTSSLANFWRIFEAMAVTEIAKSQDGPVYRVTQHKDWMLVAESANTTITLQTGKGKTERHTFEKDTRVLYFRLVSIHIQYMKEHRQMFNEKGLTEADLKGYFRNTPGFIGNRKDVQMDGKRTTAWAFDFDKVPMQLLFSDGSDPAQTETEFTEATRSEPDTRTNAQVLADAEGDDLPF